MIRYFVTLISEQTIPNLQYIKEFGPFTKCIFISTDKMEKKGLSRSIQQASDLKIENVQILIVSEESFIDVIDKLKLIDFKGVDEIVINLTLGTKTMSIGVYEYFKNWTNVKMFYTPIATNRYKNILNEIDNKTFESNISIKEYFTCYGIKIAKTSSPLYSLDVANYILNKFVNYEEFEFDILRQLRDYRDEGIKNINQIPNLNKFLNEIDFHINENQSMSKYDIQYITGGWLEEWVYYKLKHKFEVPDDQISLGVIVNATANNDLDVVFIKDNNLYVIEVKTSLGRDLTQSTLYKSGALIEKFGRAAKTYLFTLQDLSNEDGQLKPAVDLRSRQQNVSIKDQKDLLNFETLKL